jgi:hypothetical protein
MLLRVILRVSLLAVLIFSAGSAALAQTTGEIQGNVKDSSGALVPGASVTAIFQGTAESRSAQTGKDGDFEFTEMAIGHYTITFEATGFKKSTIKDVEVTIGHVTLANATLQVGGATETVTVEAQAAQVETSSTQIGAVMNDVAVTQLPLTSRDAYQLLQLQPGVQSQLGADLFYGSSNAGVVSVNGGRGRANNYMVNGGDGNDIFVNLPAIQPSPDAIEEFRVITNTFDAEYGRNSGSVVNVVTKSGTNAVHGDTYEFFRNTDLNARGAFDAVNPQYNQNQFGATIGGPVKKDKTFIFGSYEGNRLRQGIPSGSVTLPSASEAGGDFSAGPTFAGTMIDPNFAGIVGARTTGGSGTTCDAAATAQETAAGSAWTGGVTNSAGQLFQNIFPGNAIPVQCYDPTALDLYNGYVKPYGTGTIELTPVMPQREDQTTLRFDHKLTGAQQLSIYYYFDDNSYTDPYSDFQAAGANVPGFGGIFKTRVQQINASHTWTIGSTSVNEARFNFLREAQGDLNHPQRTLPSVQNSCPTVSTSNCFADPSDPSLGITTNLPGRTGVPFIQIDGGFAIGNNQEGELPQVGNTFQWTDNFTRILGKHTVKFGGDFRIQRFNQFLYYNVNGAFDFLSDTTLCSPQNSSSSCDAPYTNDVGYPDSYPNYFLGAPSSYSQGAAQGLANRNKALYLFLQDSWKIRPTVTINYGLRWELNTPYVDTENRLQTFRPGQDTTQYPCWLSASSAATLGLSPGDCGPNSANNAVFPTGLVFPGDKGVPRGLTSTYYKAFAPRIGVAWSPNWTDGMLGKIAGGPGHFSIRMGFGLFYNPIEQLVEEQFSAEPPFGGSSFVSDPTFNTPFLLQDGSTVPNPFHGVNHQTPSTACFDTTGPAGCVDWSTFRPILLFGEFQPHLHAQYSEQYNLTIERQLAKDTVLRVAYVGTEDHHLLASHDLNVGNAQTCLGLAAIANQDPSGNSLLSAPGGTPGNSCGPFGADSEYYVAPGTVIPAITPTSTNPSGGLVLPYGPGGQTTLNPGTVVGSDGIVLVGLRKYSSPQCQPMSGLLMTGCPQDGVPVFSNIFAEDTIANSNYNALQVSLDRSMAKGFFFNFSYTFSKAIDQGASFENELNPLDYALSRGDSLNYAKNRFVFSPIWEIPAPKLSGFAGKLVDGWALSGIITYQSGFPIRFFTADDQELESSFFFEDANTPEITGKVQFTNPKTNGGYFFNTSNIADPAPGTFGNSPHALCCGPALSETDASIQKRTKINDRLNTEFRADFSNLWNHTQFENPDGNFSDTTFGQVLRARDPRVLQFGLKFLF